MATASDLIRGEALVAQSGNINLGEQIGKGFETIAKSIAEAKSTISDWGEKEAELNDAMVLVDTDNLLPKEAEVVVEFLTAGKLKYAEAAKKASRIADKSSKEYKDLVKIMNDVNTSFKTLAKEKQDILDARAYVKESPNGFSGVNSLYEDSLVYFDTAKGKASLTLNEKGHFVTGNKEFRNLKSPSKKSLINKATTQVLTGAYDKVKKDGKELTSNELEKAANGLIASIMETKNHLLTTQQFLLDPIYGGISLATEEEVKGKNKEELIILAKDRYKQLLKEQSSKGKKDYVEPKKPGSKYVNVYRTDTLIKSMDDFVKGKDGVKEVRDGSSTYQVVVGEGKTDEEKRMNTKVYLLKADGTTGENFINLYKKDAAGVPILNRLDFRSLTGDTIPKQQYK